MSLEISDTGGVTLGNVPHNLSCNNQKLCGVARYVEGSSYTLQYLKTCYSVCAKAKAVVSCTFFSHCSNAASNYSSFVQCTMLPVTCLAMPQCTNFSY